MYYIYKIAYRISDEIKAQKEAEKPYWWEHLHSNVKDQSIEEIDKHILEGGVPAEKLAEMTKYEKYMAVSEGCYVVDGQDAEKVNEELESLKKEVERSKTSFLNQPTNNLQHQQQGTQDIFEPIEFGKPVSKPNTIPSGESFNTPPAVKADEGAIPPLEIPGAPALSPEVLTDGPKDNEPFSGALKGDNAFNSAAPAGKNSAELRRHAQSIVGKVVNEVNAKADGIPDDIAVMKEQELLQAVIQELQTLR